MDPLTGAAILGGVSLLGNFIGSQQAESMNKELMAQQYEYSKDLMNLQHQLNSPGEYMSQLKDAGISPAVALSKGMNQTQTSLGSTPQGDLQGATSNKMFAAQMLNLGSQTALNYANAKKAEKEAEKAGAETQGVITDNEFRSLLHQADLDLMAADTQEKLKKVELDEQTIINLHQEYERLVKETDQIEANIELIKENANKMKEETALVQLQQVLERELADSQIQVNKEYIYLMSQQAYQAAKSGDLASVEASIKNVQLKYEDENQQNKRDTIRYESYKASHEARYKQAVAGIASNEKEISDAGKEAEKGLAVANAYVRSFGKVFTSGDATFGRIVTAAAYAGK